MHKYNVPQVGKSCESIRSDFGNTAVVIAVSVRIGEVDFSNLLESIEGGLSDICDRQHTATFNPNFGRNDQRFANLVGNALYDCCAGT